jgi:hypothetical protein
MTIGSTAAAPSSTPSTSSPPPIASKGEFIITTDNAFLCVRLIDHQIFAKKSMHNFAIPGQIFCLMNLFQNAIILFNLLSWMRKFKISNKQQYV